MSKKWLYLLIMVLAMAVMAMGCGAEEAGGELTIGVLTPTTGSEAYYGNNMVQSYQLAVDEINAAGGVMGYTLKLVPEDDACDAAQAATAASKIVSADPDFVVGGYCSGATIPALQQFYDANLVMLVSAANSTNITDLGLEQTFMINSPGTHAIETLSELCASLGVVKIGIIHQGDDYTKNLSDISDRVLPTKGFEIVATEVMEKGTTDVSAIVTAIRNSGAEMIYWCGYHADGGNVIKQLRQGGYDGYICCGDGSASVELITACGVDGEGVYVTSPPYVEFAEGGAEFIEKFQAAFSADPSPYSTLCYDTIYLLKAAIEAAGSIEYEAVRDAVQAIEYDGLSGVIQFAENRELSRSNFIIIQIEDGAFKLVEL